MKKAIAFILCFSLVFHIDVNASPMENNVSSDSSTESDEMTDTSYLNDPMYAPAISGYDEYFAGVDDDSYELNDVEVVTEPESVSDEMSGDTFDAAVQPASYCMQPFHVFSSVKGASASTTVDLTGLSAGSGLGHNCNNYLVTKYDSSKHWKQCSICGKKFGETAHSMSGYWTGGDSCASSNQYISSCSCGYKTVSPNTRPHDWVGWAYNEQYHVYWCSKCHAEKVDTRQYHMDAYGNRLTCGANQNCAICGYHVQRHSVAVFYNSLSNSCSNTGTCQMCGGNLVNVSGISSSYSVSGNSFYLTMTIPTYYNVSSSYVGGGYQTANPLSSYAYNVRPISSNTIQADIWGTFNGNESVSRYYFNLVTGDTSFLMVLDLFPDKTVPACTSATSTNLSVVNGWATKKQVNLSGTENFCKTVNVTVKDSAGTVYVNNATASVSGGKWNYSFIPNIEVDASGKTFTVMVKDTFGNSSTGNFTLSKVDGKQPSSTIKQSTGTGWSKTKNFTASCTDGGIGQVSSSVLNSNSFITMDANGTSFTKGYTFTGDLYGSLEIPVVYKDGAGNALTTYLTVSNLDNTAPTISNTTVTKGYGSSKVTVTANDINVTLNKSGSGITDYGISASTSTQPATWQSSNVLSVTDSGTYYVWVKDAVGNMSNKPVTVDVISKVSFDAGNGACDVNHKDYLYSGTYSGLPIASRVGYTFSGWYTEQNASGTKVSNGDAAIHAGAVMLYAGWSANTYTVTFDAKEGTVDTSSKQVTFDAPYGELPTPQRTNYAFTGWTDANGDAVTADTVYQTASDVTLTAHYKLTHCTTTFDCDGGTCVVSEVTNGIEESYQSLPVPTKPGWDFVGWYTAPDGAGSLVSNGSAVPDIVTTTLYAHYTLHPVTVRVPKVLVADASGRSSFKISADNQAGVVTVSTDKFVTYEQLNKNETRTGLISLDDTELTPMNHDIIGTISSSSFSAGTWKGVFNIKFDFSISE